MMAPTTITEHVFIGINSFKVLPNKAAREFQKRLFESSKNLDEMRFLRTSVPERQSPHEINTTWSRIPHCTHTQRTTRHPGE